MPSIEANDLKYWAHKGNTNQNHNEVLLPHTHKHNQIIMEMGEAVKKSESYYIDDENNTVQPFWKRVRQFLKQLNTVIICPSSSARKQTGNENANKPTEKRAQM